MPLSADVIHPKLKNNPSLRNLLASVTSFKELEARIAELGDDESKNTLKGDMLEIFANAYLATVGQRTLGVSHLYPGGTLPNAVAEHLHINPDDMGVDGVYRTNTGEWVAYQVKYRGGRRNLTWGELGTFTGQSDASTVALRCVITNSEQLPAELMKREKQAVGIHGSNLDELTPDDFIEMHDWLQQKAPAPRKIKDPRRYDKSSDGGKYEAQSQAQVEALDNIAAGLTQHNRGKVTMACGTGKSIVGLRAAEEYVAATGQTQPTLLVLAPSLALVEQLVSEWTSQQQWGDRFAYQCVCSDASVDAQVDEIHLRPNELGFRVTTNINDVQHFLSNDFDGVKVVFSTYQSSDVVADAAKAAGTRFDLGLFDEAHKTASLNDKSLFTLALSDDNIQIDKRLFFTATPRHYDYSGKRTKDDDFATVYSMDNEAVYGPVLHSLPMAEAARRGIITDYQIIVSMVTTDDAREWLAQRGLTHIDGKPVDAMLAARHIALQKAIDERDIQANHVFSFHGSVRDAEHFSADRQASPGSIHHHLEGFETFHVNGNMSSKRRKSQLRQFAEAEKGIISNARCLTEGVDVPNCDMVAFMSPRKSLVDIVQATGRAMRQADGKERGYILLPLAIDVAPGQLLEEAIEQTDFKAIWDVLGALKEQDDVLADVISAITLERARGNDNPVYGEARSHLDKHLRLIGSPSIDIERLRDSITVRCLDKAVSSWEKRFAELVAYKKEHGDCNVKQGDPDLRQLGFWMRNQRAAWDNLTPERRQRLLAIGFDPDPLTGQWEYMYRQLLDYRDTHHGDCNVTWGDPDYAELARWGGRQRKNWDTLSPERQQRLLAIGFDLDPLTTRWDDMYRQLIDYRATHHGDCNVNAKDQYHPQLARWVRTQRATWDTLSLERQQRLLAIGFDRDPYASQWEDMYRQLLDYRDAHHGDCNVTWGDRNHPRLATWVGTQRKKWGSLPAEKQQRLLAIGFDLDPLTTRWDDMYRQLIDYRAIHHGDCNVTRGNPDYPKLSTWVHKQRNKWDSLPAEKQQRLLAIGFDPDPLTTQWEALFQQLLAYREEHGHCNIKQRDPEYRQLASWVNRQRNRWDTLLPERQQRLLAIGFVWNPGQQQDLAADNTANVIELHPSPTADQHAANAKTLEDELNQVAKECQQGQGKKRKLG